jgi:hypothetical protein
MSENLMVEDIDDSDDQVNEIRLNNLQEKLIDKCKKAGIKSELKAYIDGDAYLAVEIPNGREKRLIVFSSVESIDKALSSDFEKYVFLGDYVAIANYELNTIEALIRPINGLSRNFLNRRLLGANEESDDIHPIVLQEIGVGLASIEIGEPTEVLKLLARGPFGRSGALSIKISGINILQHNKSLETLRRITNSLFFQIDIQIGLTLSIVRDRRSVRSPTKRGSGTEIDLEFPKVEFDEGPISLYWYARSALGMPLLQFLAFYQVIEYYYPIYWQEEARRRIRSILKDPTFRNDRDADIGKVLSAVSGTGRGFGDERSQLRATLNACLDPTDLREFFAESKERTEFFTTKQKGLTEHKIPLATKDIDLRTHIADLIYDIRCKIVHTKNEGGDGEVELLLPFSKEAELLFHDIELIQYVARKVLVAACAPLKL